MGFLDTIKDKLGSVGGRQDDYYDDGYYDEGYEGEDGYDGNQGARQPQPTSGHLLGNTPRPEAESVSVYTRSGRPLASQAAGRSTEPRHSYSAPTPVQPTPSYGSYDAGATTSFATPASTPGDLGPRTINRVSSGQLPPYVLKPVSYDDVQTVVRRVRTNQPVVIVFRNTNIECAKRILDFCFGLSYGLNGEVTELGDRVFAVLPEGIELSKTDIDKLVADGDLVR